MTATEKLREEAEMYKIKRQKALDVFESIGLGWLENYKLELMNMQRGAMGKLAEKLTGQGLHDLLVNIPCGVLPQDISPKKLAEHTLLAAVVGFCGATVRWDINKALELCADILDDVNAHTEADKVREMIKAE